MNGSIIQNFPKYEPKLAQNLRKILENQAILLKIWPIGIYIIFNGSLFLEKWYLYESIFKFRGSTSLPKLNLSTPPPGSSLTFESI